MTVGVAYVDVKPDIGRFGVNLGAGVESQATAGMSGAGRRLGGVIGSAMKVGFAAAGVGVGLVSAFGVQAINAASDLGETISKTNEVFGDQAAGLVDYGETAAEQFGLSKRAYLDYTASFGIGLQNVGGLTGDAAAAEAQALTSLSTDLASFFNTSQDQAAGALNSALTGEFESLKAYGIIINETRLKQKALELGLSDGTGALDEQAKQAATLALIYENTETAQGDFTRTSGGLANQQRTLQAQFENVKASLGERLLPVAVTFANFLNDNLPAALAVAESAFDTISPALSAVGVAISAAVSAFQGDGITSDGFVGGMETVGVIIAEVVDFLELNVPPAIETIRSLVDDIAGYVEEHWPTIRDTIVPIITQIRDVITSFVTLVQLAWARWGDEIVAVVEITFTALAGVISGALEIIQGIIDVFTSLLTGDWQGVWDGIQAILSGAWEIITSILTGAFEVFLTIVSGAMDSIYDYVSDKVTDVTDFIGGLPGDIETALGDVGQILLDAGKAIIQGLLDGMKAVWDDVAGWLSDRASIITDLKGPLDKDKTLLVGAGQAIIGGLNDGMADEWSAATEPLLNGFTDDLEGFNANLAGGARLDAGGITGAAQSVRDGQQEGTVIHVTTQNRPLAYEIWELEQLVGGRRR